MNLEELKASRRYLSHIAVWPGPTTLDVEGWLGNFAEGPDRELAGALLESYVHLDEGQISYALASTVKGLSSSPLFGSVESRPARWKEYLEKVLVSFPQGQSGDVSASGYIYARVATKIGFSESQVQDMDRLVPKLEASPGGNILFVDDLAASGTQFIRNWKRKYATPHGKLSLAELYEAGKISSAFFIPTVSTSLAKEKIESECPVEVLPTYLIDPDYQALDADSRLVPARLRAGMRPFLEKYAPRTGRDEYGVAGFGELGLALSFHHGSPNNSLPILQWGTQNTDWRPIVH
jgi:hypothetical protein